MTGAADPFGLRRLLEAKTSVWDTGFDELPPSGHP
ncbi:MAG: hypothetical protein KatS3mg127_1695 [Silanimonas sp.]|nr:MAG: hypothetical protein KatS3mg127_1695 [Silanimonas sp.]